VLIGLRIQHAGSVMRMTSVFRRIAAASLVGLPLVIITPVSAQTPPPSSDPPAYRLMAGDKISIVVTGQPEMSGDFLIDQAGVLHLPILGDVPAANLPQGELQTKIARALANGFLRNPTVSVQIAEYRPIHILGLVRQPGAYPYRPGISVLGALAQAGGIGASDGRQGSIIGDMLQADERVRLLETNRGALLARRARLVAQQTGAAKIEFPDLRSVITDGNRLTQILDSETQLFGSERESQQRETELLQQQIPRLVAEAESLQRQKEGEEKQRQLNNQLVTDYEQLLKGGLARKATYIEVKREEARIDGNIARIDSEKLRADLALGEVNFKIAELANSYRRRMITELQETDRALLELSVTLPAALRARTVRSQQIGMLSSEEASQPTITLTRLTSKGNVKFETSLEAVMQPGDILQVGDLFPAADPLPTDVRPDKKAANATPAYAEAAKPTLQ